VSKITEDDLKQLFSQNNSFNEKEIFGDKKFLPNEKVKLVKTVQRRDNIELKKVKKEIQIISDEKKSKRGYLNFFLIFVTICGIIGFFGFGFLNFSPYIQRIDWFYYTSYLGQPLPNNLPVVTDTGAEPGVLPPSGLPQTEQQSPSNILTINKISVNAPINWNIKEDDILESLKSGVSHYQGTSLPGGGGNVFIVGHSSNYFWIKSDYNKIFALLDKLDKGDRITISYNQKLFTYSVIEKKVISPDQVAVLNSTPKEVLTLMTCWPVGTNLNRLIIQSELLYVSST
jgi:LPXTG-site transpeptidase (sortase) family protein